jgi:hypothetical protein
MRQGPKNSGRSVPRQLMVRAPIARNKATELPHGTSVLDLRAAHPSPANRQEREGLYRARDRPRFVASVGGTARGRALHYRGTAGRRIPQRRPRDHRG